MAANPILASGFVDETPATRFNHTSTIVELEPGVFLAAWVGGPGNRDPKNGVWMAYLRDGRWYEPWRAIESGFPDAAVFNPVLWLDRGGALMLSVKLGQSPENWSGMLRRSTDGGKTWSEPQTLPAGLVGPVRSKPLRLADGTWICGDSVEAFRSWACWFDRTTDQGKTWTRIGPLTYPGVPRGLIQPVPFAVDDSGTRLRALLRPSEEIGLLCQTVSTDAGLTWTEPRAIEGVPNPNSAVDVARFGGDERVYLVHNVVDEPGRTERNRLALSWSDDGGETWPGRLTLVEAPEGEFSYPAMIASADRRLRIVYSWKKERIGYFEIDPAALEPPAQGEGDSR